MPHYQTSVAVAAQIGTVWQVTRDVESWPRWTPTMDEVVVHGGGPLVVGARVAVRQPRLRPATWVVDHLTENDRFCWHTGGPGYRIDADHRLEASPNGTDTHVRLTATMTGWLARPLWLLIGRTIRRYVDQEAAALKQYCEAA